MLNISPSCMRLEDSFSFSRINKYDFLIILLKNYNYTASDFHWYLSYYCIYKSNLFFISPCNFFENFVRTLPCGNSPILMANLVAQSCWFHFMKLDARGRHFYLVKNIWLTLTLDVLLFKVYLQRLFTQGKGAIFDLFDEISTCFLKSVFL